MLETLVLPAMIAVVGVGSTWSINYAQLKSADKLASATRKSEEARATAARESEMLRANKDQQIKILEMIAKDAYVKSSNVLGENLLEH